MVVFTGIHVGVYDVDPALIFEAATRPELLSRWTIGQFENIRVQGGGARFAKGSRFLADEFLHWGPGEVDHLYEVIEYEPARAFLVQCIDGPHYVGELKLQIQDGHTEISWISSDAPSKLFDRVMCILLYAKARRDMQRHAEREVRRLIAIAKGLSKPEASERPGSEIIDDHIDTDRAQHLPSPAGATAELDQPSHAAADSAVKNGFTFDKFTDPARAVVILAKDEAEALKHGYLGTEHILLGLIREGEGVAAHVLGSLSISLDAARRQVREIIGEGQQAASGYPPFTPRAKEVLELSVMVASELGHGYVGTGHILLGLIRAGHGVAAQVLVQLGADTDRAVQEIVQLLTAHDAQHLPSPASDTSESDQPRCN